MNKDLLLYTKLIGVHSNVLYNDSFEKTSIGL
jgi:hypothetical protein